MEIGDIILVTEIKTGRQEERQIISGSPSAGLYSDNCGMSWWTSGVQWTPDIGNHQTLPKTHTCEVIKTAREYRLEIKQKALERTALTIYDKVRDGSYAPEEIMADILNLVEKYLLKI